MQRAVATLPPGRAPEHTGARTPAGLPVAVMEAGVTSSHLRESVTDPPNGNDPLGAVRVALDACAQAPDMNIERLRIAHVVGTPHLLDELTAREDEAGVLDQQLEQVELFRWQVHLPPVDVHLVTTAVNTNTARFDRGVK